MSEEKLIEACRHNDRKAQLQLYKNYSSAMYYVAYRFMQNSFEAEEAMQEGFIAAFLRLYQFNETSTFGAWLKKIVIHKSLDMLKAKKINFLALNEHILETVEEDQDWEIQDQINIEQVKTEIAKLPSRYRYPVMLFLMEGYDHQEISEILNISEVSSRTLVSRGKKKLQTQLKKMYHGTGS